jgi:hypothetical protein
MTRMHPGFGKGQSGAHKLVVGHFRDSDVECVMEGRKSLDSGLFYPSFVDRPEHVAFSSRLLSGRLQDCGEGVVLMVRLTVDSGPGRRRSHTSAVFRF